MKCKIRRAALLAVATALLTVASAGTAAADDLLVSEFWTELRPLVPEDITEYPLTDEQAVKRVLEEAQYVFSGMIYGFTFRYTPSDVARKVAEEFELTPVATIPWGDARLSVIDTRIVDGEFFARLTYRPADFQEQRYQAWQSNVLKTASGRGTASYFAGHRNRLAAIEEATKQAIRDYARQLVYNKPKEITGSLSFARPPRTIIDAGNYVASVTLNLDVREIVPYRVF